MNIGTIGLEVMREQNRYRGEEYKEGKKNNNNHKDWTIFWGIHGVACEMVENGSKIAGEWMWKVFMEAWKKW